MGRVAFELEWEWRSEIWTEAATGWVRTTHSRVQGDKTGVRELYRYTDRCPRGTDLAATNEHGTPLAHILAHHGPDRALCHGREVR